MRDRLDPEEEGLGEDVHVLEPGREPAREIGEEALGPDALDVVRGPDHQGEHERDREVGGRRVEREGRDLDAEDVDRVLGVGRQRQVADHVREPDEEEERRQEGEPAERHLLVEVVAGDVLPGEVVGELHRHLDLVRLALHPVRDVRHRADRRDGREDEVEDRLVDREVDARDVDRDPRVEEELVLRLELVVLAIDPDDEHQHAQDQEVEAEADEDLRLEAHAAASSPEPGQARARCELRS